MMTFEDFMSMATEAVDFANNEEKDPAKQINHNEEFMEIFRLIVEASSVHILRAAAVRYIQSKGKDIPDYNPALEPV